MPGLKTLRQQVEAARKREKQRREKRELKRELFRLKNPGLVRAGKVTASTGRALGRGTVRTLGAVSDFANKQQDLAIKRERSMKKSRKPKRRNEGFGFDPFGDTF